MSRISWQLERTFLIVDSTAKRVLYRRDRRVRRAILILEKTSALSAFSAMSFCSGLMVTLFLILSACSVLPEDQIRILEPFQLRPELGEQRVAFIEGKTIYLVKVDGSDLITVTPDLAPGNRVAISPDGMQVVYSCLSEQVEQFVQQLNREQKTPLVSTSEQISDIPALDLCISSLKGTTHRLIKAEQIPGAVVLDNPAFSPDGRKVLFTVGNPFGLRLFEVSVNGDKSWQLTNEGSENYGSYSSDGERIVFQCSSDGLWGQVCIMNVDGTEKRRVTNDADMLYFWPRYTPDSRYLIFEGYRQNLIRKLIGQGEYKIYVLDLADLSVRCLTPHEQASVLTVSTDGKEIVYQASDHKGNNRGIYVINIDGSNKRRLGEDWWDIIRRSALR